MAQCFSISTDTHISARHNHVPLNLQNSYLCTFLVFILPFLIYTCLWILISGIILTIPCIQYLASIFTCPINEPYIID